MLGRLNRDAAVSSDCRSADVMHLQGVGKLIKGMQHLPTGAMQVEGLGCANRGAEFCRV